MKTKLLLVAALAAALGALVDGLRVGLGVTGG